MCVNILYDKIISHLTALAYIECAAVRRDLLDVGNSTRFGIEKSKPSININKASNYDVKIQLRYRKLVGLGTTSSAHVQKEMISKICNNIAFLNTLYVLVEVQVYIDC